MMSLLSSASMARANIAPSAQPSIGAGGNDHPGAAARTWIAGLTTQKIKISRPNERW
jgi:hypothetical protein